MCEIRGNRVTAHRNRETGSQPVEVNSLSPFLCILLFGLDAVVKKNVRLDQLLFIP
jgi:hypothetical protein